MSAFPFLAHPPNVSFNPSSTPPTPPKSSFKTKHRPQPIATTPRPYRNYRRRSSCSTASPVCLSPSPATATSIGTPRTPSAAIAAAAPSAVFGSHSYRPRRKSQHAVHVHIHAAHPPASPSPPHGTKPRSPRRRRASPPSTPFAPPSPLRAHSRGDLIAAAATATTPRLPKLSKIRSLTNLRAPPSHTHTTTTMITTVSTTAAPPNSKRAKRSATPAKNSQTFQKYRPIPFIQQMQLLQFMEGGTLESHIQRHHVTPGTGAQAGMSGKGRRGQDGGGDEVAHGYAFTDERGMIWFDEEEEWEFACLIPKVDRGEKKGRLRRMLGAKKREEDDNEEDGWERFGSEDEEEGWAMGDAEADDDLRSFGGDVAMRRPEQSVLKREKPRPKGKQRRKRASSGSKKPATAAAAADPRLDAQSIRQEFLSTSFVPSPTTHTVQAQRATPTHTPKQPSLALPGLFKRRSASHSNLATHATHPKTLYTNSANPSAISLAARNNNVHWAWTDIPAAGRPSTGRSVSPPLAAAKRLGIEPGPVAGVPVMVSLEPPMMKKKGGLFGRK